MQCTFPLYHLKLLGLTLKNLRQKTLSMLSKTQIKEFHLLHVLSLGVHAALHLLLHDLGVISIYKQPKYSNLLLQGKI